MEICELNKEDEKAWDEYVLTHPSSTFYHQLRWKNVVTRSYGHKPYYLLAKEDGKIRGLLPLFLMKNLLFGRKIVSVPFAPYGGAIGDNKAIEDFLIEHAINITKESDADYLELRVNIPKYTNLVINNKYMTLILKLDKEPEIVWNRFNNKVRNAVRKSIKTKMEINNGHVNDFYNLYSQNLRDLGTPPHDKNFFNLVHSEFENDAQIIIVRNNGKPIAGAILLYFKDTVISGWAASDRKYLNLNPNNFLYWNVIKAACEKGYKFFDFGRSLSDSGTYNFKKAWGAEENQLQYYYYLNKINDIPDTSQANLRRQSFAKVWKILPLSITNSICGKLRGRFP